MLAGLVIERTLIEEREPSNTARNSHGVKKHYLTLCASIAIHLLIALALFYFSEKQQINIVKTPKKAIKSYLYKRPVKPITQPEVKDKIEKIEQAVAPEPINQSELELAQKEKVIETVLPTKVKPQIVKPQIAKPSVMKKAKEPMQATFSPYKQLNSLRDSINDKIINQELAERQQFRSPSVMHGEQVAVPHSNKQLTPAQEKEKRTTRMSDSISITKYDNGLCTIEREQFLGSPVEGSSAAFACGESKFDKSFREHMRKVQEKLMPAKNK
ncbi:MAG: hypothetical protein OQK09_05530 [Colwellia sp.]|nr:hypothetical protein [Colwellia sp.]MCW9080954.1 hypothetical protein [Colwellia sp.]